MTEQLEQEIIAYYLKPSSERDTVAYFNLNNRHQLNKILLKYNINKHSKEISRQLNKINSEKGCLSKYGVKNPMQIPEISEKARQSLLSRPKEEINAANKKASITKQKLYGDKNYNNRKKAMATCKVKFGGNTPMSSDKIKNKVAKTNFEKYGVENPFQADTVKEKIKQTCKNRYGNESYTKTADFITKTNATCQAKYGTDYYCQSLEYNKIAHKKYIYNNTIFDSSWEVALWIYAIDHNEAIYRCPIKLSYVVNNKLYCCIPDFEYKGCLIEIKGNQFIDNNNKFICPYNHDLDMIFEAKQKCLIANNVQIWTKKDVQFALDYVRNTYGKNYLKQFKTKVKENSEE